MSELRLFFGAGYRVYFGEHGNDIVVLLCGGDTFALGEKDAGSGKRNGKTYVMAARYSVWMRRTELQ